MRHSIDLKIIPPIIAHRGARQFAPENTLAAFLKAKQLGFQWVEFDVMLSKDHEVVVIHDEELMRTTNGHGAVIDYNYYDLQKLDAGSWFDPAFAGEQIPRLETVLNFLYQYQLSANIEIKALQHCNELVVAKVLEILKKQQNCFISPPLISSFSEEVLQMIGQQEPQYCLGFLMDEWIVDWEKKCDALHCVTVNVNEHILTAEKVKIIKSSGRPLLAYTVNQKARAEELFTWGVDAIFSDCTQEIISFFPS